MKIHSNEDSNEDSNSKTTVFEDNAVPAENPIRTLCEFELSTATLRRPPCSPPAPARRAARAALPVSAHPRCPALRLPVPDCLLPCSLPPAHTKHPGRSVDLGVSGGRRLFCTPVQFNIDRMTGETVRQMTGETVRQIAPVDTGRYQDHDRLDVVHHLRPATLRTPAQ